MPNTSRPTTSISSVLHSPRDAPPTPTPARRNRSQSGFGFSQVSNSRTRPSTSTGRPRTAATSGAASVQHIICSVTESRGVSATVGLCFVNLSTGECVLSEICDSQTYVRTIHKIAVLDPSEIIVPMTAVAPQKSKLCCILEENIPGARMTAVSRKFFSEHLGHEYINMFALLEDAEAIKVAISTKYYAMSAAGAALKHIEVSYNTSFALNSLRIKYQGSEGSMLIDFNTVHSLELIQNLQNPKSTNCLFGLLNNTLTPMGARILRSNILQPLTEVSTLNSRLDAVQELTRQEEMFFAVRHALKPFLDVDRLLTALITIPLKPSLKLSEQAINNIIMLKQSLTTLDPVRESLSSARTELLIAIRQASDISLCTVERVAAVQELIEEVINSDVTWAKSPLDLRNQRCYAVKSGVNGLLDVARQTYKEATEDVYALVQQLTNEHDLPLELKYEADRGFFLRLPSSEIEDKPLSSVFINVIERKKILEFTTLELVKRNAKIGDSMTEVFLMSDKTIQALTEDIRKEISALYKVCEALAMLDMVASFAHLCTLQEYVRPEFTSTLAIKDGRHPIRERMQGTPFVPNDVYADTQSRFQVVTGCNMSGKSTYLRTIALTIIMAQIGSFVPAQYASFPITHHLFARISVDEGVEANTSTFASEMREMAFILRNVGKNSVIIIDELGRGTSVRDGLAIALSVCETLIETKAFVWFATHFRDLPQILAERPGVVNLHMKVETSDQASMTMLYKVSDGNAKEEHYGLMLAKTVSLPPSVLQIAEQESNKLSERLDLQKRTSKTHLVSQRYKCLLALKTKLIQAKQANIDEESLRSLLIRLQEDFVTRMQELNELDDDEEQDL
ncbi:hypothetical protein BJ508DRAFT_370727 [Ascobolus immersus RN42]|uniref:DNA mismatch repair protein MSH3 n=1 Tax=Ascobolus immersus RN42 TaxID=1160509 RepID=A0A3N4HQY5_ASCIM|nr:hypothetical protein BJ508DRAFT_370727 [Ascobolus immersus RN42]